MLNSFHWDSGLPQAWKVCAGPSRLARGQQSQGAASGDEDGSEEVVVVDGPDTKKAKTDNDDSMTI